MKIVTVIPSWSYSRFRGAVGSFLARASNPDRLSFVFVGPASEQEVKRTSIVCLPGETEIFTADRLGPIDAMNRGGAWALDNGAEIVGFIHDDVTCKETAWDVKLTGLFLDNATIGLGGFGGAKGLGDADIYQTPYRLQQLARHDFYSNMDDWQIHGKHTETPMRIAVLDAFSQFFTRAAYEAMGTWKSALDIGLYHHMVDAFAACRMAELGREVWLLPLRVAHGGGLTSTSAQYDQDLRAKGIAGDSEIHERAHFILWQHFKDRNVLPLRF